MGYYWSLRKKEPQVEPSVYVLIFSKDRAVQLDNLLLSIRENVSGNVTEIIVLFKASTPSFLQGYKKLQSKLHPGVRFVEEENFRKNLIGIMEGLPALSFLMFLVDDNIFFNKINLNLLLQNFSKRHLFISLRYARHYNLRLPAFKKNDSFLDWRWDSYRKKTITWNYPFSLDGNIYDSGLITELIKSIDFTGPNSLEGRLHRIRHHRWAVFLRPRALAPLAAVVFNNPMNKVQTEGATWHQDISAESMNDEYLAGYIINTSLFYGISISDTHAAIPVSFVRES